MSLFCCTSISPFRPQRLTHEAKFDSFMAWARSTHFTTENASADLTVTKPDYVVQLVRQVNYGPLESKRYFACTNDKQFIEVTEDALIQANFQKLNAYKNFRCDAHDKFFELNIYQKDPFNAHHWRATVARPASSIDL